MMTKNILTHAQVYKLTRWLEEKHAGMTNLTQGQFSIRQFICGGLNRRDLAENGFEVLFYCHDVL